jgi:uncharacterized protein YqhQ
VSDEAKLRLGGMALRNGLLVHGPTHWAAAVRAPDGRVAVASGSKPSLSGVDRVPGVRGVVRLAEAMAVIPLVKRALPEARLPFQNRSVLALAGGSALAAARLRRVGAPGRMGGELAAGLLSVLPAVAALRGGELAAYHGAEHKAIGAYEQGADATEAAKEHDRCGSHLLAPMLASNLAGTALLHRLHRAGAPWGPGAVALASVGLSVEVFAWSERHSSSSAARVLRRPGHELQRLLGTREPDERQLEVGRAAVQEILRAEKAV